MTDERVADATEQGDPTANELDVVGATLPSGPDYPVRLRPLLRLRADSNRWYVPYHEEDPKRLFFVPESAQIIEERCNAEQYTLFAPEFHWPYVAGHWLFLLEPGPPCYASANTAVATWQEFALVTLRRADIAIRAHNLEEARSALWSAARADRTPHARLALVAWESRYGGGDSATIQWLLDGLVKFTATEIVNAHRGAREDHAQRTIVQLIRSNPTLADRFRLVEPRFLRPPKPAWLEGNRARLGGGNTPRGATHLAGVSL